MPASLPSYLSLLRKQSSTYNIYHPLVGDTYEKNKLNNNLLLMISMI